MGKCIYEIMHGEKTVARVDTQGHCKIYEPEFLPFSLYLEEEIDALVNNVTNFYYWCVARILTLDRKYAKEILNSIGTSQAVTDRERARIALSYHCLSLTDIFWVREKGETCTYQEINLYENYLDNAFVDVSLRGRQMTYELENFEGQKVSASAIMTTKEYSIVSREAFEVYACNQEISALEYILKLDSYAYYMMNILDYLVGNTDRHWGNWGFLVDNKTNQPVSLHPLMDFNQSFHAYDCLDGANCQTVFPRILTQREAAEEAVLQIGLPQDREVSESWFDGRKAEYGMFQKRLRLLKGV